MGGIRRAIPCSVVGLLVSLATGTGVAGDVPLTPIVSADPSHAVLIGTVATSISLPAQRYEILVGVPAQTTAAQNDVAAASVRGTLSRVVPDGSLTIIPLQTTRTHGNSEMSLTGRPVGSYVRIAIDHALTDASLQSILDAITTAADEADITAPLSLARIVSVGYGYASCAPFATAATLDAASQVRRIVKRVGTRDGTASVLVDPGFVVNRIDAPPDDAPLCGANAHRRSPTLLEFPARDAFTMRSTYSVEQPMHFHRIRVPQVGSQPFEGGFPGKGIRLRLAPASGTLLTLEGYAVGRPRFAGIQYRYEGPFGDHRTTAGGPNALATLRNRLRSAGIPNSDITAQLTSDGAIFVSVRRPDLRDRVAIVRAMTVADRRGPDAVTIRPIFAGCSDDQRLIGEAVADAAHRAAHIAALLAATSDLRPIAVQFAPPSASPCDEPNDPLALGNMLLIPRMAETSPSHERLMTRTVVVTFELQHPNLDVPAAASRDASSWWLFRPEMKTPVYPSETTSGAADRTTDLTPTDLLLRLDIRADRAHQLRPVPAALADRLAADLSLSHSSYVAMPFWNGFVSPSDGKAVHGLRLVARVPFRGTATTDAISAALDDAAAYGYPAFFAQPSRHGCEGDADALAVAAIRAAAVDAHAPFWTRPLAIDLRGPYVMSGTCRIGIGNLLPIGKEPGATPVITLAARARVAFAAR
jgi:hypothetical protein